MRFKNSINNEALVHALKKGVEILSFTVEGFKPFLMYTTSRLNLFF